MAGLKELRGRIDSVKSTRRITSAMKMVASAKLRRAQERANATRDYADTMYSLARQMGAQFINPETRTFYPHAPALVRGNEGNELLILISSDRGLCGGFNTNIMRAARTRLRADSSIGVMTIGRKSTTAVRREFRTRSANSLTDLPTTGPQYHHATEAAQMVLELLESGRFGKATLLYNKFISALTQEVTALPLVPTFDPEAQDTRDSSAQDASDFRQFEPDAADILADLLPRNLTVQIYRGMLESFAAEHAARMTAMDNASRNASKFIDELTLKYNQLRQAAITKELIEIISGAEAV